MAKTHDCKSWTHFFQAIKAGQKLHDLRYDADRGFEVGDTLHLREYDPFKGEYTGDSVVAEVTFITSSRTPCAFSSAVLPKDYCILSLRVRPAGSIDSLVKFDGVAVAFGAASKAREFFSKAAAASIAPKKPGFTTGAGDVVVVGDRVRCLLNGKTGVLLDVRQDGEADVDWDGDTTGFSKDVKWHHLVPEQGL